MALRNIMHHPDNDVLRKKSKSVEKINRKILTLLDDMADTMCAVNGFGLSAVQVGILKRVVVINNGKGLIRLINPVVVETSGEQQELEGCLSIPGIYGRVKRPEQVVVQALNEQGESVEVKGLGRVARTICHELDHLDGILFIDKIIPGSLIKQSNLKSGDKDKHK